MKNLIEKVLKTELIFHGRFLRIHRDEVELPTGNTSFREYIKHPGAAMVIPEVSPGKFIMLYQYRHAVGQVFLEFPAGKIDKGETSLQTAHRELKEETGYVAKNLKYLTPIHPVIGYSNERIDIYHATNLELGNSAPDQDELLEIVTLDIEEIKSKLYNHEITDVKTQIGVFWMLNSGNY